MQVTLEIRKLKYAVKYLKQVDDLLAPFPYEKNIEAAILSARRALMACQNRLLVLAIADPVISGK